MGVARRNEQRGESQKSAGAISPNLCYAAQTFAESHSLGRD